jgi:hypothetical protein
MFWTKVTDALLSRDAPPSWGLPLSTPQKSLGLDIPPFRHSILPG